MGADEDLAVDVGRRAGGGMATSGGFSVSAGSNRAGNDESLADLGDSAAEEDADLEGRRSSDPVVSKAVAATAKAHAAAKSAVKSSTKAKATAGTASKKKKPTLKCTVT